VRSSASSSITASRHGSNAVYSICNIAFGRVMDVQLTGKPDDRALTVQPVAWFEACVLVHVNAPSSGNRLGHVSLVQ